MTSTAVSFQSLLTRLAADGGELLRRLAVEHEKEVARLHGEIERLQELIADFTGSSADMVLIGLGAEADKKTRKSHPMERRPQERQAQEQPIGKPDENALAKAFAFVDDIYLDAKAFGDDRALIEYAPPEAEAHDAIRVLKVAADIADYAQESRGYADGSLFNSAEPAHVQPTMAGVESDFPVPAQDLTRLPGIKLSTISPPVKAPERIPEPPALPEDDDMLSMSAPLQSPPMPRMISEQEVLSEHPPLKFNAEGFSTAAGTSEQSASSTLAHSPFALPLRRRVEEPDGHGDGENDLPDDASLKPVPVFIKSVAKPENEALSLSLTDAYALDGAAFQANTGKILTHPPREDSVFPSRECTTFQAPLEANESESSVISLSPGPLAGEALEDSGSADVRMQVLGGVPSEDWRSLLQVHGQKWRPSGDDGVGIGMYLESPSAPPDPAAPPSPHSPEPASI